MGHKFLLFGTGLGGNYGLDAIALGTERIIHNAFPDGEIWLPGFGVKKRDFSEILSNSSGITVKNGWKDIRFAYCCRRVCEKMGLAQKEVVRYPATLIKQSDAVISIGGDLYTFANKETNWPYPYSIVEAGNRVMAAGKPYVIWCASVGPFEKAGERLGEIVDHLNACSAIIVREQDSYDYLRNELGITHNVHLAADPAFLMEPTSSTLKFLEKDPSSKLLAVNFSLAPIEHVVGHDGVERVTETLVAAIEHLLQQLSLRVLLVPHVNGDYEFLKPIADRMKGLHGDRVAVLPKTIGAQQTKWAISQSNALLTMRFHCSLAGFSSRTPTSLLVSTQKGEKISKEMYGNLTHCLNINDLTPEAILAQVAALLDREQDIRQQLEGACIKMQERALSAGDILKNVVESTA